MFERFTNKARQVVVQAQDEARSLDHNYIGTEHLLLGLLGVPDGVAARALRQLGLSRDMVVDDLERTIGRGHYPPSGHIPFTPRAKKCLELALREALKLSHNYIGTEHILLALVREGEGVAAKIMSERLDNFERVRAMVLAMLKAGTDDGPSGAPNRPKATTAAEEAISTAEAMAGTAPIGSHHLLEALVRAEGSMAARVFEALGVDADVIAAKIDELDPDATTDATPEEAAARKMELRATPTEVRLIFRDTETVALANKVTEMSGGPITGTGPVAALFIPLWTATNEMLLAFLKTLEPEPEGEGSKMSMMMRKVLRGRLQRRRPNPDQPES